MLWTFLDYKHFVTNLFIIYFNDGLFSLFYSVSGNFHFLDNLSQDILKILTDSYYKSVGKYFWFLF